MEKENNQILDVEKSVNNVLHKTVFLITFLAIGMMLVEFFSRGAFPQSRISTFYIGVLLIYSLHKEALHWIEIRGGAYSQRKGEYFVYFWIFLTALLYLINFLTKNYYLFSDKGTELPALSDITFTALEVCGVFILTRLFKILGISFLTKKGL